MRWNGWGEESESMSLPPSGGGSHWKVAIPGNEIILTVPAKRPIKPFYVRKLVELVDEVDDE